MKTNRLIHIIAMFNLCASMSIAAGTHTDDKYDVRRCGEDGKYCKLGDGAIVRSWFTQLLKGNTEEVPPRGCYYYNAKTCDLCVRGLQAIGYGEKDRDLLFRLDDPKVWDEGLVKNFAGIVKTVIRQSQDRKCPPESREAAQACIDDLNQAVWHLPNSEMKRTIFEIAPDEVTAKPYRRDSGTPYGYH
ncbi:MAG: hypothetical protein C5B49_12200 [Bdellovibrio sp.]|nr:MAG: hypothetical protein C5B49_12200 [Bdellovibrio sp.]